MDDKTITDTIQKLVDEEHRLWEREAQGTGDSVDPQRLAEVQVLLDECWDLLRQRRALREAARDPAEASPRDAGTVEHYLQ
jgi:Protein of unknown function (DUF2630)